MSTTSLIRSDATSYLPCTSSVHTNPAVPDESKIQKGPHAINYGADTQSPSKINFAEQSSIANGETKAIGDSLLPMLSGVVNSMKQLVEQLGKIANNLSIVGDSASEAHKNASNSSTPSVPQSDQQFSSGSMAGYDPKASKAYKPEDLVAGFSQTNSKTSQNCVTIAEMKATMQKFGGPNQIYSSIEKTRDGFDVTMHDNPNKKYHVTNAELQYAATHSGFKGNNPQMLKDANFMYAVSAKRAQIEGNDGVSFANTPAGFGSAMQSLNNFEHAKEGFDRLGVGHRVRRSTAQELANGAIGALLRDEHSVAVINGREDHFGQVGNRPKRETIALKLV